MTENSLFKKIACVFGLIILCILICAGGLFACDAPKESDDPEKGSGFEDVIPEPDTPVAPDPEGSISAGENNPDYLNGEVPA